MVMMMMMMMMIMIRCRCGSSGSSWRAARRRSGRPRAEILVFSYLLSFLLYMFFLQFEPFELTYPLIETRRTAPRRAIRGSNISVNSTLPPLSQAACRLYLHTYVHLYKHTYIHIYIYTNIHIYIHV